MIGISEALAQETGGAPAAGGGDLLMGLLPMVAIFAVFYFLLIMPQQRRMKEHKAMLGALRRGDKVVTSGGVIGTIAKVEEDEVALDIAENTRVRVVRSMIANVLSKPEPVAGDKNGDSAVKEG